MLAVALLVGSTIVWMALEAAVSSSEPHERLPREVATGIVLLAVHLAAILTRGQAGSLVAGGCLLAGGIALRVTAIRALGAGFVSSTTAPLHIVRSGPYRVMRHPSEIGLVAAATGAAVIMSSVVAGAIVLGALVPLVVVRCAAEDRVLARRSRPHRC